MGLQITSWVVDEYLQPLLGKHGIVFGGYKYGEYTTVNRQFALTPGALNIIINKPNADSGKGKVASALYSLYSLGYLYIKGHKYQAKAKWNKENPGMTLDHRYPKQWLPELTFDVNNWQPLPYQDNEEKGDKFCKELHQDLTESIKRSESVLDKYAHLI